MPPLFGLDLEQLAELAAERGLPRYTPRQIARWLYQKNISNIDEMSDLSLATRSELARDYTIGRQEPTKEVVSADGTKKYLFPTADQGYVEAAFIPEENRATLCLSVQVGCRRACRFCMTGRQGLQTDLTVGEILGQYHDLPERDRVTNIVYMGMGEPMDNLDAVLRSLEILTADWGFGLSHRRITVSTVGILPEVKTYLEASDCHLAISLHSPFEEERKRLMPVERSHPLHEILEVVRNHSVHPSKQGSKRRISFEYIMFDGVNDTPRHARELIRILHGIRCRINLIPFHQIPGVTMSGSPPEVIKGFQNRLNQSGLFTTLRRSRGQDVAAACGLLSTRELMRGGSAETTSR